MKIIGICGRAGSGKDTTASVLVEERGFVIVSLADAMKRFLVEVYGFTEEQCWGPSEKRNAPDFRYPRPGEAAERFRTRFVEILAEGFLDWKFSDPLMLPLDKLEGGYQRVAQLAAKKIDHAEWAKEAAEAGWLTPRYALQKLGTEWGRDCYLNTWIDIVIRIAKEIQVLDSLGLPMQMYTPQHGLIGRIECGPMGEWDRDDAPTKPYSGVVVPDIRYPNEAMAIQREDGRIYKLDRPLAGLSGVAGQHTSETHVDLVKENARIFNDAGLPELRERVLAVTDSYARGEAL